ncbi:MAG TPA: glycosyltransferase family 4 protein [Actinospica sp.]|nr:glycosyltransferase family 4 protein [Actinospica sp.]
MAPVRDIVIVCNNIDEAGGAQRWARSMGELLGAEGHRVLLVGVAGVAEPHDFGDGFPYRTALLHEKPVQVARKRRAFRRLQEDGAARLSYLLAPLELENAVIICVQVFAMEWIAKADTHGIPVIGMSHESYAASMASSRGARVKKLYSALPRFVALTEQDASDWTTKGGMNNTASMPNPLPFPATGGADGDAHVCVALGRLSQEKGFDLLLEAWSYVVKARPETDWRLRIHGDGPERAALEAQAGALGIADSVSFEGSTNQVPEALRSGSVFVSASRAEGFPMTLLEAQACGLPCVAFDCAPGVREILQDGVLVSLGNTEAFAEQLGRLIDDPALRGTLAKAGLESVARYTPEVIARRWERLFTLVHR